MTFIWRIYSGCYEHSKQCDSNLLYPDSLDGLAHSTSKLHLMQNNVLLLTPGHTVNAPFQFEIADKKGHYEIRSATWGYINNLSEFVLDLLDNLDR